MIFIVWKSSCSVIIWILGYFLVGHLTIVLFYFGNQTSYCIKMVIHFCFCFIWLSFDWFENQIADVVAGKSVSAPLWHINDLILFVHITQVIHLSQKPPCHTSEQGSSPSPFQRDKASGEDKGLHRLVQRSKRNLAERDGSELGDSTSWGGNWYYLPEWQNQWWKEGQTKEWVCYPDMERRYKVEQWKKKGRALRREL